MDPAPRGRKPHDRLFREVFGRQACAWWLARACLPSLGRALGRVTLRQAPGEVIERLRLGQHDLVFELHASRLSSPLVLLFEHQRTQEAGFVSRVARGVQRLRAAWRRRLGWTPGVVPLLVHQGRRPWRSPLRLTAEERCPRAVRRALGPHLLDVVVPLLDLGATTSERLARRQGPELAVLALALLRGACDGKDGALRTLERLASRFRALRRTPSGRAELELLVEYTLETSGSSRGEVQARLDVALGTDARHIVKTLGDRLFAEGHTAGKTEGKAEGKAEGQRELVGQMLAEKFGELPATARRRLAAATTSELSAWATRLLRAKTLADVLGAPRRRSSTRRRAARKS